MRGRLAITMGAMLWAAGCGSSGGGNAGSAGPAGVDGTKAVADATDAERAATCDWFAGLVGGYGSQPACASAVLSAPGSQTECLAQFPTCTVTFAEFEACVTAVVDAQKQCSSDAIQAAESSDACATVIPAGCIGNN